MVREYQECQVLGVLKGGDYLRDVNLVKNRDIMESKKGCKS